MFEPDPVLCREGEDNKWGINQFTKDWQVGAAAGGGASLGRSLLWGLS